ncbi:hypothetical protein K458DRAFT_304163, partial [Lentithecium fluviatile CBS 122367]
LSSAYIGKRVTIVIIKTLEIFSINSSLIKYFILNNIINNNIAISALGSYYSFLL